MPGDKGDPTDPVVEDGEEDSSSRGKGVQVDLKETPPKGDASAGEKKATEPDRSAEERRWKALESQAAASRRIAEDLKRQLAEVNTRLAAAAKPTPVAGPQALPAGTPQGTVDKYDKLVEDGRWQEAVDLKAELKAEEVYKRNRELERTQDRLQETEERRIKTLERSKQKVESAYPALHRDSGDPDAVEQQLFNQAIAQLSEEDAQFLHDPYAPELAMHRMEQIAREQGISLTRLKSPAPATAPRINAGMPRSRGTGGATTYTLSAEQKAFADTQFAHMPEAERYKHYARFAKMAESGGVEA